jgi:apolipoprotein N-acyltransferase
LERPLLTQFRKANGAFLRPLASGILLAVSFRADGLRWLAWIGLLPFASALSRRAQLSAVYVGAYVGGLAFNLITADWMRTLDGGQGLASPSAPNWLRQAEALAIFWPVTLYLGRTFIQAMPFLPMAVSLPTIWLCHESLVRYVSVLIDETGWPFYFLGYSTAPGLVMSQVADISGVSTASMLIACVNGGLWDLWGVARTWRLLPRPKAALVRALMVPSFLLVASLGYGRWRLDQTTVEVGPSVVLMPRGNLDKNANCIECVASVLEHQPVPDLLLWSESAFAPTIAIPGNPPALRTSSAGTAASSTLGQLENVAKRIGASIVIGCTRAHEGANGIERFNSAVFIDPRMGFSHCYDKVHLVPEREFIPHTGFFSGSHSTYERGSELPLCDLECQHSRRKFAFCMSICYDIGFARLYRQYMHNALGRPEFFTVCSSERSDSTGRLARDLLIMAKFRAIECRRAIVRNVYCGHSGTIDGNGQLQQQDIDWRIAAPTPIGNIPIDSRNSLFVLLGDWLSMASVIVLVVYVVSGCRRIHDGIKTIWRGA